MKWFALALVLLVGCNAPVNDHTPPEVTEGEWGWVLAFEGFSSPIALVTGPDSQLLVAEQGGRIQHVDGSTWFDLTSRISNGGERGLLGLAFSDSAMFGSYTDTGGDSVISKFPLVDGVPGEEEVLLVVNQPFANHNGGHIVLRDGMLYIGLGDGGFRDDPQNHGQNKATLLGSILRIDVSGDGYTIPSDNPFVNDPTGADEILHYGLRNPWRFSLDAEGNLWIGDVGQDAWEEVSYADADARGLNFGWNAYEGSQQYRGVALDHTPPVAEYANANGECSVTGGHVYTGTNASLHGWYLFGDFCSGNVRGYHPETGETKQWFATNLQISSFANINDETYLIHYGGAIYQFTQVSSQ